MALRFRQSMFWSWADRGEAKAMIGFSREDEVWISRFRDALASRLSVRTGLAMHKEEGTSTSADTYITLFDECNADRIAHFYSQRIPDLLQRLLKTPNYRMWEREWAAIRGLSKVEIETNHDFPGVLVYSSAIAAEGLSVAIREVADDLHLDLCENQELEEADICSNAKFDCQKRG